MELEHSGVDHVGGAGAVTVEELSRIGAVFSGLTAPSGRAAIADALARVAVRRVRTPVLSEARRGRSMLVNALFGRALVPTDVLAHWAFAADALAGTRWRRRQGARRRP